MTAYRAVFLLGKIQGLRLLVHGASGGVGLAAVQMAAEEGVTVVGTVGTEESIEMVRKNGACEVFNHRSAGYIDEIKRKYPGGFDLILEMSAHTNLANDLELLAPKGQVAIVGSRGEVTINPRALMMKEASVFGVMLTNSIISDWLASSSYISKFFCTSKFRPVVARVYPLNSLSSAHRDIMDSKGAKGKLIVSVNDQL
uniref:ADH_zinc_N domain-containing protein n=1 Tax=Angiostrongylus cantonensis TaxID=6313 RepID=A0A0K0CSV8_ANGCA